MLCVDDLLLTLEIALLAQGLLPTRRRLGEVGEKSNEPAPKQRGFGDWVVWTSVKTMENRATGLRYQE